jgi:hypothetical protein
MCDVIIVRVYSSNISSQSHVRRMLPVRLYQIPQVSSGIPVSPCSKTGSMKELNGPLRRTVYGTHRAIQYNKVNREFSSLPGVDIHSE